MAPPSPGAGDLFSVAVQTHGLGLFTNGNLWRLNGNGNHRSHLSIQEATWCRGFTFGGSRVGWRMVGGSWVGCWIFGDSYEIWVTGGSWRLHWMVGGWVVGWLMAGGSQRNGWWFEAIGWILDWIFGGSRRAFCMVGGSWVVRWAIVGNCWWRCWLFGGRQEGWQMAGGNWNVLKRRWQLMR